MEARLPAALTPGSEWVLGEARARRSSDGSIEACDPYDCVEVKALGGVQARLLPAPATQKLIPVNYIYVEFDAPVYVEEGATLWFYAPIEVSLTIGSSSEAARLTPTRIKYTLVGDVVDGVICRYHRSPVGIGEPPPSDAPPGSAVAVARVTGGSGLLKGAAVGAAYSRIFKGPDGMLYYSVQRLEVEGGLASVKPTPEPPLPGLSEVSRPPRRRAILHQVLQPLTIEVVG